MERIVYFDYCAFVILVVLLISTIFRKMTKGRVNRIFILLIVECILTCMADVCAINLDRWTELLVTEQYVFHLLYLLLHSLTALIYIYYIFALCDTWHKFTENKWAMFMMLAPFLVSAFFLLVVNSVKPMIFSISAEGVYERGPLFFVLYLSSAFYIIFGMIYLSLHKQLFSQQRFVSIYTVFPAMVLAVLVQFFRPAYVVEMFVNAVVLLFISVMVHRPEEKIDVETGLDNLASYVEDINRTFIGNKYVEIIMINVTNYPSLRDMLGYESLNLLMNKIARKLIALNRTTKSNAMLYYLGLGKFRYVIEKKKSYLTESLAKTINKVMKQSLSINQMEMNVLSCICIAKCPNDIDDVDSLLAFGNDLDYKYYTGEVLYAKDIFRKEYYDIMGNIDHIIENALANHKFEVYYQPIYSVKEKRFHSAEALLRLKDDTYGFISPEIFIPAAERSGQIHRIGDYVLEEVLQFVASDSFQPLQVDYIEVNLSVAQCMQNGLAENIIKMTKRYNVNPSKINLEITETAASYSQNTLLSNLDVLSREGFAFSLDDYGTGYSNMRRVASMPFSLVKLDKSFTKYDRRQNFSIVLENTIHMIKELNMQIVVEGIETKEMVEKFSELGCEYIQGFYFSKPIPKNDFVDFVREHNAQAE